MSKLSVISKPQNRRRSSSVTTALKQIPLNQQEKSLTPPAENEVKPLNGRPRPKRAISNADLPELYKTKGFVGDLKSGRWMLVPSSSFKLMMVPIVLFFAFAFAQQYGLVDPSIQNPFEALLMPMGRLANGRYTKKWTDFVFVANYIVFWSFVRQFVTIHILRPLGKQLGVPKSKMMRFTEQGYAVFYFGILGSCGIYVMRHLPTWWYKTEHFWLEYPHRQMTWELKTYYLVQAAYWLQQIIILAGKIEKPRKDFKELVAHHIVTLWLIGWSYGLHLTYIGVSIYVTMDISDIFLAFAKCVNYVDESKSAPPFAVFVGVWTYFRHFLNLKILYSVYTQFELIPVAERTYFRPWNDQWIAPWMKWQIFIPILLLQFINLFWYFLILRILYRAIFSDVLADERSDDEDEPEEGKQSTTEKIKKAKGKGHKAE